MIKENKLKNFIKYYLLFMVIWFILAGFLDLFFFIIGNICFSVFYYFAIKINFFSKSNKFLSIAFFKYIRKLISSVVSSSKECIAIIFLEDNKDTSCVRKVNVACLNQEERVLFMNIITMTPGTFVISTNADSYYIHSIDSKYADNLNADKMRELVMKTRSKNISH